MVGRRLPVGSHGDTANACWCNRGDAGRQVGLIGFQVAVRESAQSWRKSAAKSRGLKIAPEIAVDDGARGFWKALDEVFPATRHQRRWVHKTANTLNNALQ
jgi:transposase-like protein